MSDGPLGIFIKVVEQVNGINDPIMPKLRLIYWHILLIGKYIKSQGVHQTFNFW